MKLVFAVLAVAVAAGCSIEPVQRPQRGQKARVAWAIDAEIVYQVLREQGGDSGVVVGPGTCRMGARWEVLVLDRLERNKLIV